MTHQVQVDHDGQDGPQDAAKSVKIGATMAQRPQRVSRAPTFRCLNVKYSPNLGDGLLSECLEAGLIAHGAAPETGSIDLAARTGYGRVMTGRGRVMAALDALPTGLRHWVVRAPLAIQSRRIWRPHYETGLSGACAIVIGGGNLLSDHDLNFPTKLALGLEAARARSLPAAIFACGMGGRWTAEGENRVARALAGGVLRAVFLRDAASKARWDSRFAEASGEEAQVVRDPGLLAVDTYGPAPPKPPGKPVIGIGVMSDIAIRYHCASPITGQTLLRWYADTIGTLLADGAHVICFTNGAPEDRKMLAALRPALPDIVRIAQPETPGELARLVSGCDAIIAHRMHAVIGAYSYGVPALALKWDDKLDAFMHSVDRGDWLETLEDMPAKNAARRALDAAAAGLDPTRHADVLSEARADIARLYAVFADEAVTSP